MVNVFKGIRDLAITQFPKNREIGSLHVHNGRLLIKLGNRRYMLYAKFIWEKHNGKLKAGWFLRYKDGDRYNCNIENLYIEETSSKPSLTDKRVLQLLTQKHTKGAGAGFAPANRRLQDYIQDNAPELIELKRNQLILREELRNAKSK